jgi:hypothetical protein
MEGSCITGVIRVQTGKYRSSLSFLVAKRAKYRFVMEYNNALRQKLKLSLCFFRAIV